LIFFLTKGFLFKLVKKYFQTVFCILEKKLVEYRDPYTGRVLYHEGTVKTDGCPLQSTFSFFACRVIGKLSRLCRTLIFEPSLLDVRKSAYFTAMLFSFFFFL
jgi:hypothetical protein